MDTFKRTPLQLLHLPQNFVVPLFQRRYVWKEDEQWEPLWNDVRRTAELRRTSPHLDPRHFLGAIVLQAQGAESNAFTSWNVIDGQQRLTTLQLLTDATQALLAQAGLTKLANQLEGLTHNSADYVPDGQSPLKLRHLNHDRAAFDEVMTVEPPIDYAALEHADSLIARAHRYFTSVVEAWLGPATGPAFEERADELARVLREDLQMVTIELLASENSQEIFETLNARGTPLTAADLVRNFVFQQIEREGGDVELAHKNHWPFESAFWSKEVSVGRYLISRSSLFINQWLVSRTGEEIGPQATFTRFRTFVDHNQLRVTELLPEIQQQANQYETWTLKASQKSGELTVTEMAVYRMAASGVELLKPLLIWLHGPKRALSETTIASVVGSAESWLFRRQLLRLPGSDLGRIVSDLIARHTATDDTELATAVSRYLSQLNVTSTYWPGDEEVRAALLVEQAYRRFTRGRLRMFLEAIENAYRAETAQPQVERAGFPIEHILPQRWQESWPVEGPLEALARQEHVHRLGNLTLLTTSLNSKVSNGPWPAKYKALLLHNTLKLTGRLIEITSGEDWNEELIDQRTMEMTNDLLAVWPVPNGHTGAVIDPQAKAGDWILPKHLLDVGLLNVDEILRPTHASYKTEHATVGADGRLVVHGKPFDTPSGAGRHITGRATNGWVFWALEDGRRLKDVRTEFQNLPKGPTVSP
jgi:hypothetical protein